MVRCWLVVAVACVATAEEWAFLEAYPAQLTSLRVGKGEVVTIDGVLDEACWKAAAWTGGFEDIAQALHPTARIPEAYQSRVAVAFDDDFLYVAAVLGETNLWATIRGDNANLTGHRAPWWDQDFESFFNPSRTTHDYVEFETNALNATYDVLWRVPQKGFDSVGVPCGPGAETWCGNSTFNGGNETWTLAPRLEAGTAARRAFVPLDGDPPGSWTVEVRFPLRGARGGLLSGASDADAPRDGTYWYANFARAEHPLPRTGPDALSLTTWNSANYTAFCAAVQAAHPTLLGTDMWGCYWEWVWQNMQSTRYMHNPDMWGLLRFADAPPSKALCRDPEFPLRHVLYNAQRAMIARYVASGAYPAAFRDVVACGEGCCNATNSCDAAALATALATADVFNVTVDVDDATTTCVDYATHATSGAPCFVVRAAFANPKTGYRATGAIREDRYTTVVPATAAASCLL